MTPDWSKEPWCDMPHDTPIEEVLRRLWEVTQETCSCGGAEPDAGCQVCQTWHYVTGRTENMLAAKGKTDDA